MHKYVSHKPCPQEFHSLREKTDLQKIMCVREVAASTQSLVHLRFLQDLSYPCHQLAKSSSSSSCSLSDVTPSRKPNLIPQLG